MQTRYFDYIESRGTKSVRIEGCVYVLQNGDSTFQDETFLFRPDTKDCILMQSVPDANSVERMNDLEQRLSSGTNLENLLFPRVFACKNENTGLETKYAFTAIPKTMAEAKTAGRLLDLTHAAVAFGFSLHARLNAAMKFSEMMLRLGDFVGSDLLSVHPDEIYINTEVGDCYILLKEWFASWINPEPGESFCMPPDWQEREDKTLDLYDLEYFVAYAVFRILCGEDPFDGKKALKELPYLTPEAIQEMHRGDYDFVFRPDGNNGISAYIGQKLKNKWCSLPSFLRHAFAHDFTAGIADKKERTPIGEWLENVRKLRDCLVAVNRQYKFCDPDVPNNVCFMLVNDYKIPVWPGKAVYWYHVGLPKDSLKNGIAAGIRKGQDGKFYLMNYSGIEWGITLNTKASCMVSDEKVEIVEGLTISFRDRAVIRIVSGLLPDTASRGMADMA